MPIKRGRKVVKEDLSPVIPSDADCKIEEYHIAMVKYYHRLRRHNYPNLSQATFHRETKFQIIIGRIYYFFTEHDQDESTVKKKKKGNRMVEKRMNGKVICARLSQRARVFFS